MASAGSIDCEVSLDVPDCGERLRAARHLIRAVGRIARLVEPACVRRQQTKPVVREIVAWVEREDSPQVTETRVLATCTEQPHREPGFEKARAGLKLGGLLQIDNGVAHSAARRQGRPDPEMRQCTLWCELHPAMSRRDRRLLVPLHDPVDRGVELRVASRRVAVQCCVRRLAHDPDLVHGRHTLELQLRERGGGQRNVEVGPSWPANDGMLHAALNPGDVVGVSSQERPLDLAAEAFRIVEDRRRWLLVQSKGRLIAALRYADRHQVGRTFAPVVRAQRLAQIEGFDADDRVALRIETAAAVEHLDA